MAMIMISIAIVIVVAMACDCLLIRLTLGRSPLMAESRPPAPPALPPQSRASRLKLVRQAEPRSFDVENDAHVLAALAAADIDAVPVVVHVVDVAEV